jgi:hypothetical protein
LNALEQDLVIDQECAKTKLKSLDNQSFLDELEYLNAKRSHLNLNAIPSPQQDEEMQAQRWDIVFIEFYCD